MLMMVSGMAAAQSPLYTPVSIEMADIPLTEALYFLIDEASLDLSFPNKIIPADKRVSIRMDRVPAKRVLDVLLSDTGLSYKLVGEQIVIFEKTAPPPRRFMVSGFIRDNSNGERVIGATVYDFVQKTGDYSNEFGYFSLPVTEGEAALFVTSLGYDSDTLVFDLNRDRFFEVSLSPSFLTEVVVLSNDSTLLGTELGNLNLNLAQASIMPSLGGEPDIFRLAYTLPGFQAGADGFGGISVRGGNVDQNLFLLDGVPVYNATHGVGIFSVYNSSAVRSAKVLKGAFPAKYGGRLSSVWDIQTKDGNTKQFQGEFEMGLSSGKLTMEGPVNKGKGSVFFSGRRAFFDFFSKPITRRLREDRGIDGALSYFFYDFNFKASHKLSKNDFLVFSYYRGRDVFNDIQNQETSFQDTLTLLLEDEDLKWGNNIASLRWNHHFSNNLFGSATFASSKYVYDSHDFVDLQVLHGDSTVVRDLLIRKYDSEIEDKTISVDFDYTTASGHQIEFGAGFTWHQFATGVISYEEAQGISSGLIDTLGNWARRPVPSTEWNVYIQDEVQFGKKVKANLGFRWSRFSIHDKIYASPQPRLNLEYLPTGKWKFYGSANRMTQFMHLLSPSSLGLPKDLWVSSTQRVPPQHAWQFQAGAERKLAQGLRVSVEGYSRKLKNLLVFTEASVENVTSTNWQDKVAIGNGRAFGGEALLLYEAPKFGGWLAYTLARSDRQFPDKDINLGRQFPIRLDRRHNVSLQMLYKFNKKWSASLGFSFASGAAFNFPVQEYQFIQPPGSAPQGIIKDIPLVLNLNSERMPTYHRLDVAFNRNFWQGKTRHGVKLGFYNLYNRKNPLYFSLRDKFEADGTITTEFIQVSLLPIFPTLRYSLEFR